MHKKYKTEKDLSNDKVSFVNGQKKSPQWTFKNCHLSMDTKIAKGTSAGSKELRTDLLLRRRVVHGRVLARGRAIDEEAHAAPWQVTQFARQLGQDDLVAHEAALLLTRGTQQTLGARQLGAKGRGG